MDSYTEKGFLYYVDRSDLLIPCETFTDSAEALIKMDFKKRLANAVERGHEIGDARVEAESRKRLSQAELKRMHREFRMELTDHIETCLRELPNHFPGFQFETIVGEQGWGYAINRDDLEVDRTRQRHNFFSRFEITVRPVSDLLVLELTGKGTIRNKEIFNRTFFKRLGEVDLHAFEEVIDNWVLEYAQRYATL